MNLKTIKKLQKIYNHEFDNMLGDINKLELIGNGIEKTRREKRCRLHVDGQSAR